MKKLSPLAIGISVLTLAACTAQTPEPTTDSEASSSESTVQETKNVMYSGIVRAGGVGIFMQGTHTLELSDGRFILLESTAVTLDDYLDTKAEVYGAIRPTVETSGQIMRVERVTSLKPVESSSSAATTVTLRGKLKASEIGTCDLVGIENWDQTYITIQNLDCTEYLDSTVEITGTLLSVDGGTNNIISMTTIRVVSENTSSAAAVSSRTTMQTSSKAPVAASSKTPVTQTSSIAQAKSSIASAAPVTGQVDARATAMAKDNLAAANWTQEYCSTHIGFCVPVHKNWWFTSFGATSSTLWHMEIGNGEVVNLGDGPLAVNLISGDLSGRTDGEVVTEGGVTVGYRSWTNGRHFEIRGPSILQNAIRHITENLKAS